MERETFYEPLELVAANKLVRSLIRRYRWKKVMEQARVRAEFEARFKTMATDLLTEHEGGGRLQHKISMPTSFASAKKKRRVASLEENLGSTYEIDQETRSSESSPQSVIPTSPPSRAATATRLSRAGKAPARPKHDNSAKLPSQQGHSPKPRRGHRTKSPPAQQTNGVGGSPQSTALDARNPAGTSVEHPGRIRSKARGARQPSETLSASNITCSPPCTSRQDLSA